MIERSREQKIAAIIEAAISITAAQPEGEHRSSIRLWEWIDAPVQRPNAMGGLGISSPALGIFHCEAHIELIEDSIGKYVHGLGELIALLNVGTPEAARLQRYIVDADET